MILRLAGMALNRVSAEVEKWARDVESRLAKIEVQTQLPRYRGHNPGSIGPGDYAHVDAVTAGTYLYLSRPSIGDIWRMAYVRHTTTASFTIQAVGCSLDGYQDGNSVSANMEMFVFIVVPGDSAPEWMTLSRVVTA